MPSGRQWVNVIHARYAAGASSPGPTEIAALDAILVRLYTGAIFSGGSVWFSLCSLDVKLTDATYYVLNGTASPVVISHVAQGSLSTNTGLPSEVAHCITLRTGTRGRRYRGRIYLPAVSAANAAGGNLLATAVTSTLAQLQGIVAAAAAIQWEIGVASYGSSWNRGPNNAHGAASHVTWSPFFTSIGNPSQATMDQKPDVQRRRK